MTSRIEHDATVHRHRLSAEEVAEICTGGGGAELVRKLWTTERSRRLMQFHVLHRHFAARGGMGPLPEFEVAWDALAQATTVQRAQAEAILLHPQVGAWAAYVLRRRDGNLHAETPLWVDVGVLHAVALVACARAGLRWSTRLPARFGQVMLPALGMAVFPGLPPWSSIVAECEHGVIRLRGPGREIVLPEAPPGPTDGWWPLHRLVIGDETPLVVHLDDLDPFRELADPVGPDRLDPGAVARWRTILTEAWELLCRHHPETARAISLGVVVIVPLPGDRLGGTRSASTGEAFGSMMTSLPADAADMAVAMVHEFQHNKLGGLIHLVALTGGAEPETLRAPWRDDPRPLGGVLQGIFAFIGIAEFWRVHRRWTGHATHREADFEFAYAREQVIEALAVVAGAEQLTEWGDRLVAGLNERIAGWRTEPVDGVSARAAALVSAAHEAEWRLRHLVPDPATVRALTEMWAGLGPVRLRPGRPSVVVRPAPRWSEGFLGLVRRYVAGRPDLMTPALAEAGATGSDVALVTGDRSAARRANLARIEVNADDPHAWAGLGVGVEPGSPLRVSPELVRAVYVALRERAVDTDPEAVSRWLAGVLPSPAGPVRHDDVLDPPEHRRGRP